MAVSTAGVVRLLSACRTLTTCGPSLPAALRPGRGWRACWALGVGPSCHVPSRSVSSDDKVTVHFINRDGDRLTAEGKVGESLLDVVVNKNLDIDGFGACEGTLACSTCHLIFEDHVFEQLDPATDEEMDMLDLAYGLTETSRLGCQICLTKKMADMTVRVPEAVADARQTYDMGKNA
ncbi:adrenodoxin, mitochondrial [Microcaecilia unicolor]|uniref:Adrenal ferredoxin n=1 Tax=Microcaecilia unicolor TaxID=1415580 RepID=A0A6P7XID0_9AMPH|nr:adrenodoxin, mitochondrial [Microcaecilia unicolor]